MAVVYGTVLCMYFLKDFPSTVQSYMASDEQSHQKLVLQHCGKFIKLAENRHSYEKRWSIEVMGAGSLSCKEQKCPCL